MTREEAIKILKAIRVYECYPKSASEETKEAIDMAIEALSAERTGEWLHEELIPNTVEGHVHGECSACHAVRIVDNYCPNCGTRMK